MSISLSFSTAPNFLTLPPEIHENIIANLPLAQIFSLIRVNKECYELRRRALIQKAKFLGCQSNDLQKAIKYIQLVFSKFVSVKEKKLIGYNRRKRDKAIQNEEKFLNLSLKTAKDQEKFFISLNPKFKKRSYLFLKPNLEKEYIVGFAKRFFDLEIPQHVLNKFSLTFASADYEDIYMMGMVVAIIGNHHDLFFKILELNPGARENSDALDLIAIHSFYTPIKDIDNNNILHLVAYLGDLVFLKRMFKENSEHELAAFKLLINSSNYSGKTPLQLAKEAQHDSIVKYFNKINNA